MRRILFLGIGFVLLASSSLIAGAPASADGTLQVSVQVVRSCTVASGVAGASVDCGARASSIARPGAASQPAPHVSNPAPTPTDSASARVVTIEF